jgi:hypothetical protein
MAFTNSIFGAEADILRAGYSDRLLYSEARAGRYQVASGYFPQSSESWVSSWPRRREAAGPSLLRLF